MYREQPYQQPGSSQTMPQSPTGGQWTPHTGSPWGASTQGQTQTQGSYGQQTGMGQGHYGFSQGGTTPSPSGTWGLTGNWTQRLRQMEQRINNHEQRLRAIERRLGLNP